MKPIVLIAPFARKLRDNKNNPKNYPYWKELVELLQPKYELIQLGTTGEETFIPNTKFN